MTDVQAELDDFIEHIYQAETPRAWINLLDEIRHLVMRLDLTDSLADLNHFFENLDPERASLLMTNDILWLTYHAKEHIPSRKPFAENVVRLAIILMAQQMPQEKAEQFVRDTFEKLSLTYARKLMGGFRNFVTWAGKTPTLNRRGIPLFT